MLERLITFVVQNAARRFLPRDIDDRLKDLGGRVDNALKEIIHAYAIIGKFSDKYDAIQTDMNRTLKAQLAINKRLFTKTQQILDALDKHDIKVDDNDPTLH